MVISRLIAIASASILAISVGAILPSLGEQKVASVRLKCSERSCVSETPPHGSIEFYTADEVDDQLKRQVDVLSRKIAELEIQLAKERIKRDLEVQQLNANLAKRLNELPLELARHNTAYEMLRNRLAKDFEQVFAPRPNQ
jgi:hypothetical protein